MVDRPGLSGRAHAALVGVLAFLVYLPSLTNGFALDDVPAVAQDERIRDLGNVPRLLVAPYLTYMPAQRSPYRPLTTASYAVSWALGDGHPAAFHATNVAMHVVATLLVLSLLTALGTPALPASIAASVFAVHPVHVEAVAGIVGRADILATIFTLLAVRLYLVRGLSPSLRVAAVSLAYLLALASKEGAIALPLLILVVEWIRPQTDADVNRTTTGAQTRTRLLATWPTLLGASAALAIYLGARRAVLGGMLHLDIAAYIAILPTKVRITTAVANLTEHVRLLIFPADLSPEYGPAVIMPAGVGDMRFWLGIVTLCGGMALVANAMRSSGPERREGPRWVAAGVLWIGASVALVSNLILPLPMWIAERTLYLPSVGLSMMIAGGLAMVPIERLGPRHPAFVALTAAVLLGFVHSTRHSRTWENDEALFSDLVERHPESFRAQWWIGGRMIEAGQLEGGLRWLAQAVELNSNGVLLTLDYARALLLSGKVQQAESLVRPIPPYMDPARSVYLAQSLILQDRPVEAIEAVRVGLEYFPDDPRLLEQARQLDAGG